jgi:1-acyl-sn-glycerol-3-phosphate acyltransferase
MRRVRAAIRLALLIPLTALLYLLKIAGAPLLWISPRAHTRWRDAMFRLWARNITWILGMRVTVNGTPPRRPFFLVTNHLGYVDILLLARYVQAVFVAKAEIERWPLVGPLVTAVDTIFIDREHKRDIVAANESIAAAMDAGEGIVLFAEGTSSNGESVLPLLPSLLEIPASRHYPVCYAGITYTTPEGEPAAADSVCWWGGEAFVPHLLRLLRVSHFDAHLCFGSPPVVDEDRKRLAMRLHEAIVGVRQHG